jgi:hypothetical protein
LQVIFFAYIVRIKAEPSLRALSGKRSPDP